MSCSVPDCAAEPVAKGLCSRHYRAHLRDPGRELTAASRRSSKPRKKVLVALAPETLERVARLAAAAGQTVQDWLREAVEWRLRKA